MVAALLSPRMLLLHAVAIVAVTGATWLGFWQVGAWQENRHDKADALVHAPAIPLDEALGPDDTFPSKYVGQPVRIEGTWLPDQTRQVDGWAVTPVATASGSAVLVVRGQGEAPAPQGAASLTGWLQPSGAVRVVDFLQTMDQDLYGGYVIAKEPLESGLTPVTPDQLPKPGAFTSLRNLLYGLEWWVFGGFAGFLWWRWCRDEVDRVASSA